MHRRHRSRAEFGLVMIETNNLDYIPVPIDQYSYFKSENFPSEGLIFMKLYNWNTGPRTVGNMSGNRYESDCRSRGRGD